MEGEAHGKESLFCSEILADKGGCYRDMGKYKEAVGSYGVSLGIKDSSGGKNTLSYANVVYEMGGCLTKMQRL